MKRLAPAILALALLSATGCSDDLLAPDVAPDGVLALPAPTAHNHTTPFWERDLDNPANGDVQLYAGEGIDPLYLVWDLDGGTALQATAGGGFRPVFGIEDFSMEVASDVLCTVEKVNGHGPEHFLLFDAGGTVLLTQWQRYIFEGGMTVPSLASPDDPSLLQDGVLLSFKHDQVFFGRWHEGQVAVTASVRIEEANPMRKMVVAALVAGYCGSSGPPPS